MRSEQNRSFADLHCGVIRSDLVLEICVHFVHKRRLF